MLLLFWFNEFISRQWFFDSSTLGHGIELYVHLCSCNIIASCGRLAKILRLCSVFCRISLFCIPCSSRLTARFVPIDHTCLLSIVLFAINQCKFLRALSFELDKIYFVYIIISLFVCVGVGVCHSFLSFHAKCLRKSLITFQFKSHYNFFFCLCWLRCPILQACCAFKLLQSWRNFSTGSYMFIFLYVW